MPKHDQTPDPLYQIFENYLHNALWEEETESQLIARVVDEYMGILKQQGIIPRKVERVLQQDLSEEVQDMLRKKTYGHFSLREFRRQKKGVAKSNKRLRSN